MLVQIKIKTFISDKFYPQNTILYAIVYLKTTKNNTVFNY